MVLDADNNGQGKVLKSIEPTEKGKKAIIGNGAKGEKKPSKETVLSLSLVVRDAAQTYTW